MKEEDLEKMLIWATQLKEEDLATPNFGVAFRDGRYYKNPQTLHFVKLLNLVNPLFVKAKYKAH